MLPHNVFGGEKSELRPDAALFEAAREALTRCNARFVCERLVTVDAVLRSRAARHAAWTLHSAAAIDMETHAMATAANERGVPWLAVRVVLDTASMRLPGPIERWESEGDDWRVARAVAVRPWDWPATLRLAVNASRSLRALSTCVRAIAEALETGDADTGGVSLRAAATSSAD
jgi:hypothetical protein